MNFFKTTHLHPLFCNCKKVGEKFSYGFNESFVKYCTTIIKGKVIL